MPCVWCLARQTDPGRGPSPWKSGVRAERQVLICPDCQRDRDWTADLDRCAACGSTMLGRRLGETRCRGCGHVGPGMSAGDDPAPGSTSAARPDDAADLADEVAAALARLFHR